MGRKSKLSESEKVEVVLALLRQQEPAAVLSRRYGVSDATLYRWRDEFLEGGKAALRGTTSTGNGSSHRVADLERQLSERDLVIGDLTVANRILKKVSGALS
jgi:transposase-like protein